jgi:hypothetical protein
MAWIVGLNPTMTVVGETGGAGEAVSLIPLEVPALRCRFGRNDNSG